jgi:hypothetical protein
MAEKTPESLERLHLLGQARMNRLGPDSSPHDLEWGSHFLQWSILLEAGGTPGLTIEDIAAAPWQEGEEARRFCLRAMQALARRGALRADPPDYQLCVVDELWGRVVDDLWDWLAPRLLDDGAEAPGELAGLAREHALAVKAGK